MNEVEPSVNLTSGSMASASNYAQALHCFSCAVVWLAQGKESGGACAAGQEKGCGV